MRHVSRPEHSASRHLTSLGILETLAITPRDAYGVARSLTGTLGRRTHGEVYPILFRLERAGWIASHWQSDGRRRVKYYSLAPTGRRVLARSKGLRNRPLPVGGAMTALAFTLAATSAAAQDAGALPRVRSSSPFIRELFSRGTHQSPTFRHLIDAIDDTDGIVYVEDGHCGHGVHNCLLWSVTSAGGFRFLKILVDTHRVDDDHMTELVASVGHELRHALEVLSEPHVQSTIDLLSLYANQGAEHAGHFETMAAIRAGNDVLRDLSSTSRRLDVLNASVTH